MITRPLSPYARYGATTIASAGQVERQHVVKAGETVQAITATEFPTAGYDSDLWRQVAEANGLDDLDALTVNTVLTIPPITLAEV